MFKVGFTGTQHGMTLRQKAVLKDFLTRYFVDSTDQFHHGDCIGADEEAHEIAKEIGYEIHIHPPKYEEKRAFCKGDKYYAPRDYLVRNRNIVDMTDKLLGASRLMREELRSGTWSTIRYAKKNGKKYTVILPQGTFS